MPGVTIVYAPLAAAVPTLGSVPLAALAAVTALAGAAALRKRSGGTARSVAAAVLAVGAFGAAIGLTGHRLVARAEATPLPGFNISAGGSLTFSAVYPSAAWGTVSNVPTTPFVCAWITTGPLTNRSGVAQKLNSVELTLDSIGSYTIDLNDADYTLANTQSSAPRCAVGSVLQPNTSCQVILGDGVC